MNPFLRRVLEQREREMAEGEEPEIAPAPVDVREYFPKESFSFRRLGKMEGLDPKLVNSLRVVKWQRENPDKHAAKNARHYAKPGVKDRQLANARARRAKKPAPVLTCIECQKPFVKRGRRGGTVPKTCSTACYQRHRYQAITPGARRVARRGSLKQPLCSSRAEVLR